MTEAFLAWTDVSRFVHVRMCKLTSEGHCVSEHMLGSSILGPMPANSKPL